VLLTQEFFINLWENVNIRDLHNSFCNWVDQFRLCDTLSFARPLKLPANEIRS